jgi:hypothetical protein
MYEVLSYEATLELLDTRGRWARFEKREQVRYLQDHILAYQDHAWGDGEILLHYRCMPGTAVDRYRPGQKTYILISLREVKARGDVDEFTIEWRMRNCFRRRLELWETEVSHRTKQLSVRIIFPEARPPTRAWVVEQLQRRSSPLEQAARRQLPDGRWLIHWATAAPRLHERYLLQWEW